jgi:thiol-disulfide isomerase/thioredoxin
MWLKKNSKVLVLAALIMAVAYAWYSEQSHPSGAGEPPADLMSSLPKMVELYAPGCPSCRAMDPLLEHLKERCGHRGVGVDKVDISRYENEHIAEKLGVFAVPTFVFLDQNGAEVSRLVGRQTASTLMEHLATLGGECADRS